MLFHAVIFLVRTSQYLHFEDVKKKKEKNTVCRQQTVPCEWVQCVGDMVIDMFPVLEVGGSVVTHNRL